MAVRHSPPLPLPSPSPPPPPPLPSPPLPSPSPPSQALSGKLMPHFEQSLQNAGDSHKADTIRQSIVVLMGTLAKHMDKGNPKVRLF